MPTSLDPQIASCHRQDAGPPQVEENIHREFLLFSGFQVWRSGTLSRPWAGQAFIRTGEPEYTRRKHPLLHLNAQATAVTLLVWLLLGGFHTLYLVYATGWRDFQIVIRWVGAFILGGEIH